MKECNAVDTEYELIPCDVKVNNDVYLSWADFESFLSDVESAFKKEGQSAVTGVYPVDNDGYVMAQCIAARLGTSVCMNPVGGCIAVKPIAEYGELYDTIPLVSMVRYAGDSWSPDYAMFTCDRGSRIVFPWSANGGAGHVHVH